MAWDQFEVTATGNVVADATLRHTQQDGKAVLSFRMASTTGQDRQSNEKETVWTRVTLWGADAERLIGSITKGTPVIAVGRLTNRPWKDKEGNQREGLELTARYVAPLVKVRTEGGGQGQQARGDDWFDQGEVPF